jgi:uncharacterized protein
MLAEMGDTSFMIGNVHTSTYAQVMTADALLDPIEESFADSAPMCSDCAYEPFCGADPVYHHATFGDALGRKPASNFCRRNTGVFQLLLRMYNDDSFARRIFGRWASR